MLQPGARRGNAVQHVATRSTWQEERAAAEKAKAEKEAADKAAAEAAVLPLSPVPLTALPLTAVLVALAHAGREEARR